MFSPEERLKFAYTFMQFQRKDLLLDFWQDAYVRSTSRFISIVKSRRVGWSFICALKGVIKAMDPDRIAYTKQFVSYNEDDAVEKINYAKQFYESLPEQCRKKIRTDNKSMLEFYDNDGKTVSRLISIPCRPPRGKGGDLSLDEFAIFLPKMSKLVYDASLPVISRGGCIEMGSSPLGKVGQFYDILTDKAKYPKYERYNIKWWYCRDLTNNVPEAIRNAPSMSTEERVAVYGTDIIKGIFESSELETFQQEYECLFIDSEESFITLDLIYANTPGMREGDLQLVDYANDKISDEDYWCNNRDLDFQAYTDIDKAILNYDPDKHGKTLYLGYDIGRVHDKTSIYVLGVMPDGKKRSFMRIELKEATYEQQRDAILKIYKNLPIFRGCFDMTGLGGKFMQDGLLSKLGERIIGVDFTPQNKEVMAIDVKRGLEQREFLLENNKSFHQQIHSIKRTSNGGKFFKYDANRNETGHADSFWAWALANYAIAENVNNNFYARRATQKQEIEVNSNDSVKAVSVNESNITVANRRGRNLNKVLGGFTHANS